MFQINEAIQSRLNELKEIVKEENGEYDTESEKHLLNFIETRRVVNLPYISCLDNGVLRAYWYKEDSFIGLSFLPDSNIIYVLKQKDGIRYQYDSVNVDRLDEILKDNNVFEMLTK